MRTHRQGLRRMITMLLLAAVGLGVAAPAQASDASLRKVIKAQEKKDDALATDFAEASSTDTVSAVGRERARISVVRFKSAVKRLRIAVAKEHATTARVKRGRTRYLAAVGSFLTGLTTFQQGLIAFDPDAPARAKSLIKRSAAQLASASKKRDKAAKMIGGLASLRATPS